MEINKFQELPDYINALPEDYIKSMGGITHTVDNLYPTLYGGHNLYRYPKKKVLVVAEPTDALVLQYLLPNIVVVATGKDKETDALETIWDRDVIIFAADEAEFKQFYEYLYFKKPTNWELHQPFYKELIALCQTEVVLRRKIERWAETECDTFAALFKTYSEHYQPQVYEM